jgi:hypothetical protein
MAKSSKLRQAALTREERDEPTKLIVVRVPRSWHALLQADGIISDKLLEPLAAHVKRLRRASE